MSSGDPILVSVSDAARIIGISRPTFYKLLGSGQIEAVQLGGRTLVKMASLRVYTQGLPRRIFEAPKQTASRPTDDEAKYSLIGVTT